MKILIVYFSKGGNTKKLAEAIVQGVQEGGCDPVLRNTEQVTRDDFVECRGVIAGSPVYFGTMAAELKGVMDGFVGVRKKMEDKVGAAFATSGDATGGKETTMMSIIQALMIYGMVIAGDPMSATGHYGVACVGEPDPETRENAVRLGRRVAELSKRLHA